MPSFLTAQEAAAELDISLPTLYAYVSRGLIRSEPGDNQRRTRRYHAEDVARLKERQANRRDPGRAAETALHYGSPLLESALTLIDEGRLYYRGRNAITLAQSHSLEQVAALLWADDLVAPLFHRTQNHLSPLMEQLRPQLQPLTLVEQFLAWLPIAAASDFAAYDLSPDGVRQTGARILDGLVGLTTGQPVGESGIGAALQQAWLPEVGNAAAWLNAALILCADHELNISAFTARCVASAGATPYGVVQAGLAALQGSKHGGYSARVEALFREVQTPAQAQTVLTGRLRRGEGIPGFHHPLYPEGDPRGRELLHLAQQANPDSPALALAHTIRDATFALLGQHPTLDFGLVTLCQTLNLPPGTAITLFALGRTVGWIGHALEQYARDELIRPRARYVGPSAGQPVS